MFAASNPDLFVAQVTIGGLALVALWRFIVWIRDAPRTPDPWDAEFEQKIQDPALPETCHHCSTPQPPGAWFCSHCGNAVGPYNNLMPYLHVFSEGEVLRNGVTGRFQNRWLIATGFFLMTLGVYPLFAPVYLLLLLSHLKRSHRNAAASGDEPLP
ncbi:MAG: zinc ribbon domain-containing protein [Verrucomicrobia bacterium]|nr:zinc ribbon domain-containing protein [Verrucomicrobiota bacterium]